jgi:hypothetical protein
MRVFQKEFHFKEIGGIKLHTLKIEFDCKALSIDS